MIAALASNADTVKAQVSLIVAGIEKLAEAKRNLKLTREQIKDSLERDDKFNGYSEQISTLKDNLKREEERVKNNPEVSAMTARMAEIKEEVKEIQTTLENHLYAYESVTGKTVIETLSGKKIYLTKKVKLASGQLALFEKE